MITRRGFLQSVSAFAALPKLPLAAAHAVTPAKTSGDEHSLWYRQPAQHWLAALPLGNAGLGAVIYGGAETERIALWNSTAWSGKAEKGEINPQDQPLLVAIRQSWTDDFNLDINTQQNYWPAEVCNLSKCQFPLVGLLETLRRRGRETAEQMYGAQGWVAHTVTNPCGYTASGGGQGCGFFVTADLDCATALGALSLYGRRSVFQICVPGVQRGCRFLPHLYGGGAQPRVVRHRAIRLAGNCLSHARGQA